MCTWGRENSRVLQYDLRENVDIGSWRETQNSKLNTVVKMIVVYKVNEKTK